MGNLEKAGVLVVVVLLAIILGVAFINNGDDPSRLLNKNEQQASGASQQGEPKDGSVPAPQEPRRTSGGLEIINGDENLNGDRPSNDPPPKPSPEPQEPKTGERPAPRPETPPKEDPKPAPVTPAPVVAEWPKKIKVEKSDTSLLAVARRVYGAKDAQSMIPAVLKQNPGLKPTSMKVGQELSMPAKPGAADAKKPDAPKPSAGGDVVRADATQKGLKKDAKPAPKTVAKNAPAKSAPKPATKPATKPTKSPEKRRLAFQPAR